MALGVNVSSSYPECRVFRIESEAGRGDLVSNLCGVVIFADEPVAQWLGHYWQEVKESLETTGGSWKDLGTDGPEYWNAKGAP